jgi:hypothetical protein
MVFQTEMERWEDVKCKKNGEWNNAKNVPGRSAYVMPWGLKRNKGRELVYSRSRKEASVAGAYWARDERNLDSVPVIALIHQIMLKSKTKSSHYCVEHRL